MPLSATVTHSLEIVTQQLALIEDISEHLLGGTVDCSTSRNPKLTAEIEIDDKELIDDVGQFLRITRTIEWDDGSIDVVPLGVYVTQFPSGEIGIETEKVIYRVEDISTILYGSVPLTTEVIPEGTPVTSQVAQWCSALGYTFIEISDSDKVLAEDADIVPPDTYGGRSADLLGAAAMYAPYADLNGSIASKPYIDPANETPLGTITMADVSDRPKIIPQNVMPANVVVATHSLGDSGVLTSIAVNNDPDSPVSVVSRGGIMKTREHSVPDEVTQEELDAIALRLINEERSLSSQIELTVYPLPVMGIHGVYLLDLEGESERFSGIYQIANWSTGLTYDEAVVEMTLKRATNRPLGTRV